MQRTAYASVICGLFSTLTSHTAAIFHVSCATSVSYCDVASAEATARRDIYNPNPHHMLCYLCGLFFSTLASYSAGLSCRICISVICIVLRRGISRSGPRLARRNCGDQVTTAIAAAPITNPSNDLTQVLCEALRKLLGAGELVALFVLQHSRAAKAVLQPLAVSVGRGEAHPGRPPMRHTPSRGQKHALMVVVVAVDS